jgi:hypothetical protein
MDLHAIVWLPWHDISCKINRHKMCFFIFILGCCALLLLFLSLPLPSSPPPPSILPPPPFHPNCPTPVCLAVLDIDDGNNNHVPSLIVLSRKSLAHLQNFWPYPSADTEGRGGGDDHHNHSDSLLTAATRTMTMMIVEDGETMLVHSHSGRIIRHVHSPSLPGCHHCCLPAATSQ